MTGGARATLRRMAGPTATGAAWGPARDELIAYGLIERSSPGRTCRLTDAGRAEVASWLPTTVRRATGFVAILAGLLTATPQKARDLAAKAGCTPRRARQVLPEIGRRTPFGWVARAVKSSEAA